MSFLFATRWVGHDFFCLVTEKRQSQLKTNQMRFVTDQFFPGGYTPEKLTRKTNKTMENQA